MKKVIFFASLFLFAATLTSCTNDDDSSPDGCSQSDWIGTYSGTCNDVPYTLKVTEDGNQRLNLELILQNGSDTSANTFNGCNYSFVFGGISISATLDQDTIIYNDSTLECSPITFMRT
ncbi:MAG: hypothetical protein CMC70_11890 [Flavobacteriaceae bacterium]|nr:hypothetical protein [Flavobacteriaceae bacterium]